MPSTQPGKPGPNPNWPGGLPDWPSRVARAPRVRAPGRTLSPNGIRFQACEALFLSYWGRGLWGPTWVALGGTPGFLESYQNSKRGRPRVGLVWDSISYIKACIQGLLNQVFGELFIPSEFLSSCCCQRIISQRFSAAKKNSEEEIKAPTRFYKKREHTVEGFKVHRQKLFFLSSQIFVLPTKIRSFSLERVLDQAITIYEGE